MLSGIQRVEFIDTSGYAVHMCMMFYLGTETPLDRKPWVEGRNLPLCVQDLQPPEFPVQKHFKKPHVCYVGAYEGCGCGFLLSDERAAVLDPEEYELVLRSREQLVSLLRGALDGAESLELFVCWAGDEGCAPEHYGDLVPEDIITSQTEFREREFIRVTHSH